VGKDDQNKLDGEMNKGPTARDQLSLCCGFVRRQLPTTMRMDGGHGVRLCEECVVRNRK